jgi:choline dehydrogenase
MRRSGGFDLVIIGAGAAGCVLARRFADRGDRTVALLEAGPDLRPATPATLRDGWRLPSGPDWPDWGYESSPDKAGGTSKLRRGRLMGGSSWLTRFAVRSAAHDFDAWAAAGNPGWSFEDVLPAFRRLETDVEHGADPWHGDRGPLSITRYPDRRVSEIHAIALDELTALGHPLVEDVNAPDGVGVGRMPMSSRAGVRLTTLDAYLPPDWTASTLRVLPNAPVDRIVIDGSRVRRVRLMDGTEIEAGSVILSAGVYGSPAILLRSGVGPAGHVRSIGVDLAIDLPGVGSNLADHPSVELDSGARGEAEGPALHSIARYRSELARATDPPDLMFWLIDPDADDPTLYLDPILLRPRSRGTVRLRTADPAVAPIIDLPGVRESVDVERLAEGYERGLELAARIAARTGATSGPARTSRHAARAIVRATSSSIPHTVGTCAMGPSPAEGAVVDARGSVHGVEGLSVIDASIIPEPPSGFPHLVTIMIAEHLSR